MAIRDTAAGYGWGSILLHWATAVIIVVMLYVGSSIDSLAGAERQRTLVLHTSIAITTYALLWLRIVWRFAYGHPGPLTKQGRFFFLVGKWVHILMLVALAVMLISGPLLVWTMGEPIRVFDWFAISSPLEANVELNVMLHAVHGGAAMLIFVAILLHIGGVYKHTAFNQDGTLTKMIIPARDGEAALRDADVPAKLDS
jgi:cytochrome b561